MRRHHEELDAKHPSVGAHRNLGLFGIIDLVRSRDPFTPMTPFNGTSDEMKAVGKFLRDNGLYTMIANNSIHTNPPLCITEEQLGEGFEIIDRALDIADQAVDGLAGDERDGRPRGSSARPAPSRAARGAGVAGGRGASALPVVVAIIVVVLVVWEG